MKTVETKKQYEEALKKIDELMIKIGDNHSFDNPDFVMMDRLSDLVAQYEDKHFKIETPSLIEVIKLRMYELGLKQSDLAQRLDIPKTRVSEHLRGKRDITMDVARKLHKQLNIDGDIILQ
ncbi:helix-turn-helix domain-containing protein [Fulvivirgaceae bacterium BMA12]|uniref:Helix-turn-helix domain-containing protein n=1 Tax=Agaribacillus aureus TaxID=3051825 RepID=A0ABT8LDZ2_9BACT|nr:helix-turn-helix domain-containing protein [Fulvivirgaceae bacterium BMA12]